MKSMNRQPLLTFHPETVDVIRKTFNLDKPGAIDEAIDIIVEWIAKQDHFIKRDFPRRYLEASLVRSKSSIERVKELLDKMCTARTMFPNVFTVVKLKDMVESNNRVKTVLLPKLTKDHYRIYLFQITSGINSQIIKDYYMKYLYFLEYASIYDYNMGIITVYDMRNTDIMEILKNLEFMEFARFAKIVIHGYGIRVKSVNIISSSKAVNIFASTIKQLLPEKIANRFYVHENLENLYDHVEKDNLPIEYGGTEISLTDLANQWIEHLSTDEFMEFVKEMNAAKVDENLRKKEQRGDDLLGIPGTFRNLNMD